MIVEDINGFPQNSNSSFSHSSTSDTDQPARFAATGLGWFWRIYFVILKNSKLLAQDHNLRYISTTKNVQSLVTYRTVLSKLKGTLFLPFEFSGSNCNNLLLFIASYNC